MTSTIPDNTSLAIPTDVSDLPDVVFDADAYRADLRRMSDDEIDDEIERTVQVGIKSLTGFAMAVQANALARCEQGQRTENVQGHRADLLPGSNKFTATERKQRSENRVVIEWLDDDAIDKHLTEGKGFNTLVTVARAKKRESAIAAKTVTATTHTTDWTKGNITGLLGDFRERLADIPDGSVDLIVTDPPYPAEYLPLWTDLAMEASRLLGPRGILFAWSGKIALPEVMERLGEHLTYGWMFRLELPGSHTRIMGRHIRQTWKPILAYTNGTWPSNEWGEDMLTSPTREKTRYEWEQNAAPALELIKRYSPKGGLIVDPFLGVGSFAVAAQQAKRRFIGCEIDVERLKESHDRISEQNVER